MAYELGIVLLGVIPNVQIPEYQRYTEGKRPPQVRVETHAEWSAHRHSPGTKTPRRSFK